jgi:phospholipid/cholesterol/gamma-HCH transport system substrate-binding protein
MNRNTLETIMGAIVLLAAVGFVALAYEAADVKGNGGYEIAAEFGSTGGM